MTEKPKALPPYIFHGVKFDKTSGKEHYGNCPFCEGHDKFYVNEDTGLFDCKVCGLQGNHITFLNEIMERYCRGTTEEMWDRFALERGIPKEVLKGLGAVYNGYAWLIPVRNAKGTVVNIIRFKLGEKQLWTAGLEAALHGVPELEDPERMSEVVYLTEGIWDKLSMEMILAAEGLDGIVVSVPGSESFKDTWTPYFSGRSVVICYDNDNAGKNGTRKVTGILSNVTRDIRYLSWPEGVPNGYDIRDFLSKDYGTYEELAPMFVKAEIEDPLPEDDMSDRKSPYEARGESLIRRKVMKGGTVVFEPLTNFSAKIVADRIEDDGVETERTFEMEAKLHGRTIRFALPAAKFSGMISSADTTYDDSIDDLITEMQPGVEYAIDDTYLLDTANTRLQAVLKLGMLEVISGEFLQQLLRKAGASEEIKVAGLTIGAPADHGAALIAQGWERLRPFRKAVEGLAHDTGIASTTRNSDRMFDSDSMEVW